MLGRLAQENGLRFAGQSLSTEHARKRRFLIFYEFALVELVVLYKKQISLLSGSMKKKTAFCFFFHPKPASTGWAPATIRKLALVNSEAHKKKC